MTKKRRRRCFGNFILSSWAAPSLAEFALHVVERVARPKRPGVCVETSAPKLVNSEPSLGALGPADISQGWHGQPAAARPRAARVRARVEFRTEGQFLPQRREGRGRRRALGAWGAAALRKFAVQWGSRPCHPHLAMVAVRPLVRQASPQWRVSASRALVHASHRMRNIHMDAHV